MSKTILQGVVTSASRDKTITVSIASRETHPLYRKQYTKTRKYTAHDEKNTAKLGDIVTIEACRPISKTKHYKLAKVVERAKGTIDLNVEAELPEKERMTDQRNESEESILSSPSEADRTALDSEGGKR